MARGPIRLTGRESPFGEEDIIVSKTDPVGRITYANDVFCRVSGYALAELLGKPHSIIRHPDMPRCAFKLCWDTLKSGNEFFAYVLNAARNGDHYWVYAHITPSHDANGALVGYHSNRRKPAASQVVKIAEIYRELLRIERAAPDSNRGMAEAFARLQEILRQEGVTYDKFVWTL
ncbi:MAG: PAS domain-containing protein [Acetobacteraceae bacterium]|nr:PAS domain-containing protein [Acetobacteraceae bacterium]